MFYNTVAITFILQFTIGILAAPASGLPTSTISSIHQLIPGILGANSSSSLTNSTNAIPFPIEGTFLTLQITPLLGPTIARNDIAVTLYESREYVRRYIRSHPRARLTGPFSSTGLPIPPVVNCVVRVESGKQRWGMWYKELDDTLQGLMDYEYFPSSVGIPSLGFRIVHRELGEIGFGNLKTLTSQGGRDIHIQKV
ncbi:hypothetical protein G7Y79_00057g090500 [Physcia stellaris]|nr:hypothetical protein G7Y79_00057g090500 [Physcia stellaris]